MKIEAGIEKFLKELEARGRSPFTLTHYRGHLRSFSRWLERRESAERSDGESSLSLDLRKIEITIRFRKSSSPYFKEAVRIAKELPGYRSVDTKLYEIKVPAALEDLELWERVKQLADLVGCWKRSEVVVEGTPLENFWEFEDSFREVRQCFAGRGEGEFGNGYCSGKEAPDDEACAFGCRHVRGVSCDIRGNSESQKKWYQFGKLTEDLSTFRVDRDAIQKTVESQTARQAATTCPAFSWERVREEIDKLPDSIELGDSSPYEVKYSEIDPSKPLGIKLRESPDSLWGSTFSLGNRGEREEGTPRRNVPEVRYSDIAAQDAALKEVKNVIELPMKHPEYFAELGVEPQRGVILYGPPGNGKTMIAKAVATESDAHLEIISGPEILSKWVGESERNLREVFERARELEPSVILIDEIDALAPSRDVATQHHQVAFVAQLLVLLDGLEERGRVQVIATTNRLQEIDLAVRRAGRFDLHIEMPLPDEGGRREILERYLQKMKTSARINPHTLAAATAGFSGAELAAVLREAGLGAIERGLQEGIPPRDLTLEQRDLEVALEAFERKRT